MYRSGLYFDKKSWNSGPNMAHQSMRNLVFSIEMEKKITLILYSFLVILQPRALCGPLSKQERDPLTDLRRLQKCVTILSFILDTAVAQKVFTPFFHTYFGKKSFSYLFLKKPFFFPLLLSLH